MAQLLEETSTGEGQIDDQNPSQISIWITQNNLPQSIIHILKDNEIFLLQDLTLFESEHEMKEFVDSLGLKFATKKKFIAAVRKLMTTNENPATENNSLQDSPNSNNAAMKPNIQSLNDDEKQLSQS